jgi:hypothetical protein
MEESMNEHFERFLSERRYLQNVSARTIEWYRAALQELNDPQPNQQALKLFVIRMRERGLKATSCTLAFKPSMLICIGTQDHN